MINGARMYLYKKRRFPKFSFFGIPKNGVKNGARAISFYTYIDEMLKWYRLLAVRIKAKCPT